MGESSSECNEVDSHVASSSGMESAPRDSLNFSPAGECGGVMKDLSLTSRVKTQLRVLRGEPGVRGESHPSVLMVFVGDKGGVM